MQTEYLPYRAYQADKLFEKGNLSPQARRRLDALDRFDVARKSGVKAATAATLIGVPKSTLFAWRKQFRPRDLRSLEPRSRKPKRVRSPQWSMEALERLKRLRQEFPVWGKKKLRPLLCREGFALSESSVGRMLKKLRLQGDVVSARILLRRGKTRRPKRSWAKRLARGQRLMGIKPGEAVQVDTLTVRPSPGVELKHFNAVCTVSKWNVGEIYSRATATNAKDFLHKLVRDCPFPLTGLQIDGGSEFMAEFEDACRTLGIALHVLAPKSPELNGSVERVNKTWRDELYDLYDDLPSTVSELRPEVGEQQNIMNFVRPHEGLDLLTPAEYLRQNHPKWAPQSKM